MIGHGKKYKATRKLAPAEVALLATPITADNWTQASYESGGFVKQVSDLFIRLHPHCHNDKAEWKQCNHTIGNGWRHDVEDLLTPDEYVQHLQPWVLANMDALFDLMIVQGRSDNSMAFCHFVQCLVCILRYCHDPRLAPMAQFIRDHAPDWTWTELGDTHTCADPKWLLQLDFWQRGSGVRLAEAAVPIAPSTRVVFCPASREAK